MEKTKLGLPVNIMEGICYFTALFGGILGIILLAIYIYLKEDNSKLKTSVKKAIFICLVFTIIEWILNLILGGALAYGSLSFFDDFKVGIIALFFGHTLRFINVLIKTVKTIIFLILGMGAISENKLDIPCMDRFFN